MKRIHIHVGVDDLHKSIDFYSRLFGESPVKAKPDYAKWMLDDPRVNFAISTRGGKTGLDHLGIQVDDHEELEAVRQRMEAGDMSMTEPGKTVCCYAHSEKTWLHDPAGIPWESFRTMEYATLFSDSTSMAKNSCCAPDTSQQPDCCVRLDSSCCT